MRLDIPQEQPRRREGDASAPGSGDALTPVRRVPENPIHHHLHARGERVADIPRNRQLVERRRHEPAHNIPRERRRLVASADPRRPVRVAGNLFGLELRPEEKQLLREAGRFRVIRTADLRETLYNGKVRLLENDLKYLRDKGLIETQHINLRRDARRRTIERVEVVTLTKHGRTLLIKDDIENTTSSDVTLPATLTVMQGAKGTGALHGSFLRLDKDYFIPAHHVRSTPSGRRRAGRQVR